MKHKKVLTAIGSIVGVFVLAFLFMLLIKSIENDAIKLEENVIASQVTIIDQNRTAENLTFELVDYITECDENAAKKILDIADEGGIVNRLDEILSLIDASTEAHAELQENSAYMSIKDDLDEIADTMSESRAEYNDNVTKYNTYVRNTTTKLVLFVTGYNTKTFNYYSHDISRYPHKITD